VNIMNTPENTDADDSGIEAVLREIGSRPEPSRQATQEVCAAVYAEWRALVGARMRRRRQLQFALAASVLLAVLATAVGVRVMSPHEIASVIYRTGLVSVTTPHGGEDHGAATGTPIRRGDVLTMIDGRATLRLAGGLVVRLDTGASVRFLTKDRIELQSGGVYVDAGGAASAEPLTIENALGSVRHVGTQYQVRAGTENLDVLVRQGRVEITSETGITTGTAGERVKLNADGEIERGLAPRNDPAWAWTLQAARQFDIQDQTLDAFLAWAARETGRELVYDDSQAQIAARELKLRGSIAGLSPEAAVDIVLATTRLHRRPGDDAHIRIALNSAQ
jgi:ferric-dicitrate binding protein FerR (iron transport regulator)